jgi:aspartate dehydrogenase
LWKGNSIMRAGLIGCGTIGDFIARSIAGGQVPGMELIAITDTIETDAVRKTAAACSVPFSTDVAYLTSLNLDLVIEAAAQGAARQWAPFFLGKGINMMVVSVGALADTEFLASLMDLACCNNCLLYVPSGAIGGLDIIKAANVGALEEVTITTTKPPKALAGSPYVVEQGVDLSSLKEATTLWEGPAIEAVRLFPQNVNVAASLSLAGIGAERTRVRVVVDPASTQNIHEVYARGDFGEATIRLVNQPSPSNPKTSYLAPLSAVAALCRIASYIQLGT